MTVWRLDTGAKAISERRSQDGEATVQLSDITKESEECKSRRWKEAYEELKVYGEENIISAVIHGDETTPHLHCDFVPLTKRGIYRRKTWDRRQRKCAGRKRNF